MLVKFNELDPAKQEEIIALITKYPTETAEALNGLPTCEVCGGNIPGRPGDPDGLCRFHADIDKEWDGEEIPEDEL